MEQSQKCGRIKHIYIYILDTCNLSLCHTCMSFIFPGSGTLYIIDINQDGLIPHTIYDWNDGLFDVTWAENNENVLVTASGDGGVVVWDTSQPRVY